MVSIAVDFPAPFGPSSATVSPRLDVEGHVVQRADIRVVHLDDVAERDRRPPAPGVS